MQLVVILLTARGLDWRLRRIGQPVIGREIFTLLLAIVTTRMTTSMLLYFNRHPRTDAAACSRHPDPS